VKMRSAGAFMVKDGLAIGRFHSPNRLRAWPENTMGDESVTTAGDSS
jgi:hypothetical protein